ncbi:hypothetical protein [Streptomyces sp. NPDC059783]|uniref:hypothetical protein n=1 Tax=Streptomyces sp. NPDC059783 TaxID=3346944 RepID=UPI00365E30E3
MVSTAGVPDAYGHSAAARPAEPTYTRAQISEALTSARTRLAPTGDPAVLDSIPARAGKPSRNRRVAHHASRPVL